MRTILTGDERSAFDVIPSEADEYVQIRYGTLQRCNRSTSDLFASRFRGDHNRLAIAIHIALLRWLGWQPDTFDAVPRELVAYLARQLNLGTESLTLLAHDDRTWCQHLARP